MTYPVTTRTRRIRDALDNWAGQTATGRVWRVLRYNGAVDSSQDFTETLAVPVTPLNYASLPPRGSQITVSEKHPNFGRPGKLSPDQELRQLNEQIYSGVSGFGSNFVSKKGTQSDYDVGGPFLTRKISISSPMRTQRFTLKNSENFLWDEYFQYEGPILTSVPAPGIIEPPYSSSNLKSEGTTAIARCSPVNMVGQALNDLYEIRTEGLPKLFGAALWKDKTLTAKNAGEEYLNKEFGWAPLVGDIKATAFAVANAHTVLDQYERNSGRVVRRRYAFPDEESSEFVELGAQNPLIDVSGHFGSFFDSDWPGHGLRTGGVTKRLRQTTRKVWFSGAFTYHLPTGYKSRVKMVESATRAQTLLGLRLTPEVVWNATPWTWAIDWFSNAGDVVANLSRWVSDGQVLKYGYVMEHQTVRDTYFMSNLGLPFEGSIEPAPIVVTMEQKRRVRATPFGFNVDWPDFSPRQIAIAVALGFTHR